MNTKIMYVNKDEARVTKAFKKQANIFGTKEFQLWRKYLAIYPDAKMVTKNIKKNPDRKTNRNLTYPNMEKFLRTLPEGETLIQEFETVKARSCVKTSPYRFVLEWFEEKVSHYDSYASFVEEVKEKPQTAEIMQLPKAANE